MMTPCRLGIVLLIGNHAYIQCYVSFIMQRSHPISVFRTSTVNSDNFAYPGSRFLDSRLSNVTRHDDPITYSSTSVAVTQRPKVYNHHFEINKIFPNNGLFQHNNDRSVRQNQVDKLIYYHLPEFNQASIAILMYRSAKEWKKTRVSVISRHLSRITSYMSRLPSDEWTAKEVSNAVYGLQYMKSDDLRVLKFLSVVTDIMSESLCVHSDHEYFVDDSEEYSVEEFSGQLSNTDTELYDFLNQKSEPFIPIKGSNQERSSSSVTTFDKTNTFLSTSGKTNEEDSTLPGLLRIEDLMECSSFSSLDCYPQEKIFTPRELSTILYSLRGMRSDVKEVKDFLNVLNKVIYIGKIVDSTSGKNFDVQGVSNALYGIQGMSSDCVEVRTLLTQLTVKIAGNDDVLDGQAIGNSLYGLKNMKSDHPEVRLLLRVLAIRINQSNAELKSQEMANALYGLQGMNSNHVEVKELLIALEKKINDSKKKELFNGQEIGNALYGMQKMNSDSLEVRKLLLAITKKMTNFNIILNAQAIGSALVGFKGMSSDHVEVRKVLNLFNQHLQNCDILDEKSISSIFGLQRMNSASLEVREFLSIFGRKLDFCQGRLSKEEIINVLFGIQNLILLDECEEVTFFVNSFINQIKRSVYLTNGISSSSTFQNNDNGEIVINNAGKSVESVINSIKSVKKMCGVNTQLAVEDIMSLLIVGDCS